MYGLGLCIKLNSFVAHMFYPWSFSHNAAVLIATKQNTYFISLDLYNTVFSWVDGNSNKNRT